MSDAELQELLAPALTRPVPSMAFSLDDVVRRGHVVRQRRAFAALATIVVAAMLIGGFTMARTRSTVAPAAPRLSRAELQTTERLDDLLSVIPLPSNRTPTGAFPGLLPAQDPPAGPSVHRIQWFHVAMQPPELDDWIKANGWLGGVWVTSSTTDDTSGSFLFDAFPQVQNVDFPDPIVSISLTSSHGGSVVRVDAWQRPVATPDRGADTILSDAADAGSAYRSTLTLTLTGTTATALRTALNRLPLAVSPSGVQCASDDDLSLVFHDGARMVSFRYQPDCPFLTVEVDGRARPALAAYDPRLLAALAPVTSGLLRLDRAG